MEEKVEGQVRQTMANVFGISSDTITGDTSPLDIEQWDSLRHMNLILALEDECGVEFPEASLGDLTSLNKICAALSNLK